MAITNFLMKDDETSVTYPLGSLARNANFMVSHCMFFTFNFINVIYLVFVEGYAFRRFGENPLLKIALCACFSQLCSCVTSIHRVNIDDEYGFAGRVGTWLGVLGYMFTDIAYSYLMIRQNVKARRWVIMAWCTSALIVILISEMKWEENHFNHFRRFIGLSMAFHVTTLLLFRSALKTGYTAIEESILPKDSALRLLKLLAIVDILYFAAPLINMPIIGYPGAGITYSVMVITMVYAGRMDFLKTPETGTLGENQPLHV